MKRSALRAIRKAGFVLAPLIVVATSAPTNAADRYDPPIATQKLADRGDIEVRCTWHPGFMVRERMEGPTSEAATLVRGERPSCTPRASPEDRVLDTAEHFLAGRKGPYLVFHALNPHGAASFAVIDARSGRRAYADMLFGADLARIEIANDRLRVGYLRGVNAPCSLLAAPASCWKRLVAEGAIPASMAGEVPGAALCAPSYAADRSPAENPSIVTYEVEVEITGRGEATTLRRGRLGCRPMP